MTPNQLKKSLENADKDDTLEVILELIAKVPEAKQYLDVKLGFVNEQKIDAEFARRWVKTYWGYESGTFKFRPSKAKKLIKAFGKNSQKIDNYIGLYFYFCEKYVDIICTNQNKYHLPDTVLSGCNTSFSEFCKLVKKHSKLNTWRLDIEEIITKTGNTKLEFESIATKILE
jgi:hypothetical protein